MIRAAYTRWTLRAAHPQRGGGRDGCRELETLASSMPAISTHRTVLNAMRSMSRRDYFCRPILSGDIAMKALSMLPRPDGLAINLKKPAAGPVLAADQPCGCRFPYRRPCARTPDNSALRAPPAWVPMPACVESVACIGRGTGTRIGSGGRATWSALRYCSSIPRVAPALQGQVFQHGRRGPGAAVRLGQSLIAPGRARRSWSAGRRAVSSIADVPGAAQYSA